jgi:hypothetical protein
MYAKRVIALFLAINILAQVVSPSISFALTSGPSQPEVQSFEPIEANTMVNDFTGDFDYNIPLMTVPGPNGGYPINMSYHAGITMDQEASWCGLGWNINPGVITRNMRGLPDDFNGDVIKKEMYQKPQKTYSIGAGFTGELNGLSPTTGSLGAIIRYDNYKGITLGFNDNLSGTPGHIFNIGWNANYDPQTGIGLNPSIGIGVGKTALSLSASINSRNGLSSIGLNLNCSASQSQKYQISNSQSAGYSGAGAGTSFGSVSMVPNQNFAYSGFDIHFLGKLGLSSPYLVFAGSFAEVGYKQRKLTSYNLSNPGYGYLNYQNHAGSSALFDYNRDNNGPVSYDAPALEMPVSTYDVYAATGQGIAGTFRPFRSDIGVFHDPSVESTFNDIETGFDFGGGVTTHIGANLGDTYSQSYSGMWKDEQDVTTDLFFSDTHEITPESKLYVPHTYFKAAGELTSNSIADNELSKINSETPVVFDMNMVLGDFLGMEPHAKNKEYGTTSDAVAMPGNYRLDYEKRDMNMHYRTFSNLDQDFTFEADNYTNIYAQNANPASASGTQIYDEMPGSKQAHHIAELSVYKNDGMKYVYGLPVYNTEQHEYVFNLDGTAGEPTDISALGGGGNKWIAYTTAADATANNENGEDEFYSQTKLPAYVHSYMLTAIFSPDYVDLTGNGPTDDDMGYYVKFNYSRIQNYQWRTPLIGAKYDRGYISHRDDQKGTFMYGKKDVFYLNSVETKSHIAVFTLGNRKDSYGPHDEHIATLSPGSDDESIPLRRLNSINLFSKKDLAKAIKTVSFNYDYSLCRHVINNSDERAGGANADSTGKLTLKKLTFTYQGNTKGALSPYEFSYASGGTYTSPSYGSYENPNYNPFEVDRWGNYKLQTENSFDHDDNFDNPYTDQYSSNNNAYASAWNLKKIKLPSGAEMKINYEADDYGYVQDKRAMQMCIVTGTGNSDCFAGNKATLKQDGCNDPKDFMDRVYFKLVQPTNSSTELDRYFDGIENLYFKVLVNLKEKPVSDEMARDYVEGYCKIENWGFPEEDPASPHTHAWVRVKFVPAARTDDDGGKLHPFRKAAFEYMKLKRPDLFFPPQNTSTVGVQFVSSIVNLFTSVEELIAGYYHACVINGYAESLLVDQESADYHPSFIRLNNPFFGKVGGGHRVSKIEIADNWNLMASGGENATYGQEYKYVLDNGKSSGVAEYEPMVGGEENPWKQPSDRFAAERKVINKQKELYSEEPYGEALFPGASVGYSRIVVKNIDHGTVETNGDNNARTENGVSVKEFYTAKDFPVKVTWSEVKKIEDNFSISIPFVGSKTTATNGFSQGFVIELNDMHGKPKSEATYSYSNYKKLIGEETYGLLNQLVQPVSKTNYIYNTISAYNSNTSNYLNNKVSVMEQDGIKSNKQLGVTYDFNVDMNENSDWTLYVGDKVDYDLNIPPPPLLPVFWFNNSFNLQYSDQMSRSIVSSKVIMRNGILKETQQWHEGSYTTAKNLVYDANTGAPLLTTVTNEFDKPVYNYEYKANWYYPDMKNNGTRYRYVASGMLESVSGQDYFKATLLSSTAASFMKPGDILLVNLAGPDHISFYGRVTGALSSTELKVMPEGLPTSLASTTIPPTNAKFVIIKPAESNQQSISSGFITSLHDPTDPQNYQSSVFASFNDYIATTHVAGTNTPFTYVDNCSGNAYSVTYGHSGTNQFSLFIRDGSGTVVEEIFVTSPVEVESSPFPGPVTYYINNFSFYYIDYTHALLVDNSTGSQYIVDVLYKYGTPISTCNYIDGVIRAAATTFTNSTTFDYTDINSPDMLLFNNEIAASNTNVPLTAANTLDNPYRFGQQGVWRVNSTYTYLAQRAQATPNTNIAEDGTVRFRPFNWLNTNANDPYWSLINTVSLYSPHGFELENKDVLGNYSSALYGYNNQLPVSIGSNAPYYEQGFDGFEDYPTTAVTSSITPTSNNGHFRLTASSNLSTTPLRAHTGKQSLNISGKTLTCDIPCYSSTYPGVLSTYGVKLNIPSGSKKYTLTYWVHVGSTPAVSIAATAGTGTVTVQTDASTYRIEGWQRMEHTFSVPSTVTNVEVQINTGNLSNCYIDDIRIQPFQSSQKTFVYNPVNLWLVAELDERNFATFYNYDEEGALTQVKKETINGISTIKSVRKNTYNH